MTMDKWMSLVEAMDLRYPQEFFAPLNIIVEAYHNYIKYPLACSPLGRDLKLLQDDGWFKAFTPLDL